MKREAKHVRSVLDGLISKLETGAKKGNAVLEAWNASIDEKTRMHARAVSLKGTVLTIVVQDSVWLHKLTMEKRNILRKFNENYSGRKKAAEARFRVGAAEFI